MALLAMSRIVSLSVYGVIPSTFRILESLMVVAGKCGAPSSTSSGILYPLGLYSLRKMAAHSFIGTHAVDETRCR